VDQSTPLGQHDSSLRATQSDRRGALLWTSAQVLLTADDPVDMLRRLFPQIREALYVDTYVNFLVDENEAALRLASCDGIPPEEVAKIQRLDYGQAICGTAAAQRTAIVATDIQRSNDPKVQLVKGYGIRAYACNPLLCGDRLLGTLSFATHTHDSFDDDTLEFFRSISLHVAVAHDRANLIKRLRDADRRKDEFLATLAHELRNPLTSIRASTEVMRLKESADPDLQGARDILDHQVNIVARLVEDLLDVSRLTLGRIELRFERVTVGDVLNQAIETSRPTLESFGHELFVELAPDPIYVDADPIRLAQAVTNLLTNAAKYTPPGGRIRVAISVEQKSALIRVVDNGIGIPLEMLSHIFDLFRQGNTDPARQQDGLGIGLTITRRLVELHRGTLDARSAGKDRGSEFVITLPVAAAPVQASRITPAAPPVAFRLLRILIIDDNERVANSLARLTRLHGHEVHVANGGERGIELAREIRPEIILLDIGMPGMDGYQTCCRLRAEPCCSCTTIIALTGWGQDSAQERSRSAGFDLHWVKPIDSRFLSMLPGTVRSA
jgi:signal transduction histidine kinase